MSRQPWSCSYCLDIQVYPTGYRRISINNELQRYMTMRLRSAEPEMRRMAMRDRCCARAPRTTSPACSSQSGICASMIPTVKPGELVDASRARKKSSADGDSAASRIDRQYKGHPCAITRHLAHIRVQQRSWSTVQYEKHSDKTSLERPWTIVTE